MSYFLLENKENISSSLLVKERGPRIKLLGQVQLSQIVTGDIIALVFWKNAIIYRFEGICIAIKKFSLIHLDASICVRNIILGVGIEVIASYFANRVYFLSILDYKRKQFFYRKSKLYYLRHKINRASRVK